MKEPAEQHYFGCEQMQPRRDRLGVFAKNERALFDDLRHAHIAACGRFKNHRRQRGDFHFVRGLGPANELIEIVQGTRVQNFCGQLHFAAMEIVFAQDQAERADRDEITSARIAQNVSPTAGILDPVATTPGN